MGAQGHYGGGKGQGSYGKGYGQGNFGNSWGKGRGQWQPRQDGFGAMATQFNDMMGSLAALGQMAKIGSALTQAQGSGTASSPQKESNTQGMQLGGEDLAEALTGVITRAEDKGDTRLQNTVRKLSEFLNSPATRSNQPPPQPATASQGPLGPGVLPRGTAEDYAAAQAAAVEESPAFKKLRADVDLLATEQKQHKSAIAKIENTTQETSTDMKKLLGLFNARFAHGGHPAGPAPGGDGQNLALFAPTVTEAIHDKAIGYVGITSTRREASDCRGKLPLPFKTWWDTMGTLKGLAQWKTKLTTLECPEEQLGDELTRQNVGKLLYQYLLQDGTWAEEEMQEFPTN